MAPMALQFCLLMIMAGAAIPAIAQSICREGGNIAPITCPPGQVCQLTGPVPSNPDLARTGTCTSGAGFAGQPSRAPAPSPAFAPGPSPSSPSTDGPSFSLLEIVDNTNGPLGPQNNTGSNVGDLTYFDARVTDLDGVALGHASGLCVYIVPGDNFEQQCTFSIYFDGGDDSLNMQGRFLSTPTYIGVSSGTGVFAAVRGYLTSTLVSTVGNSLIFQYDFYLTIFQ